MDTYIDGWNVAELLETISHLRAANKKLSEEVRLLKEELEEYTQYDPFEKKKLMFFTPPPSGAV